MGLSVRDYRGMSPRLRSALSGLDSLDQRPGTIHYVDAYGGADGSNGRSWDSAMLTMGEAFDRVASGDTIYFKGNVTEQLSTPVQVFDVSIVGVGPKPRHVDSAPVGGESGASWRPPGSPAATTPLLKIQQQGWNLVNFLMDGPSDAASVQLFRDGGAGDDERDASHATLLGMKIVNGSIGVQDSGGCGQFLLEDCEFFNNTTDLAHTTGAGIGQPWLYSTIRRCRFRAGTNGVILPTQGTVIEGCHFAAGYTEKIDLSGGVGSNIVGPGNALGGTYSNAGGYTAGTNDDWVGNFIAGGVTTADPA